MAKTTVSSSKALKTQTHEPTITIDGNTYAIKDLSADAQAQIASLRATDQHIVQLQTELAIAQTARNAYARALTELLPKDGVTKQ